MKSIPLTEGFVAIVDDQDFEAVSAFKWHACFKKKKGDKSKQNAPYAARKEPRNKEGRPRRHIFLHRWLLGEPDGLVDHRNGKTLDCRRENLRVATHSQNQANKRGRKMSNRTARFKGVSLDPKSGKWRARIAVNKKDISLGTFLTQTEAARAYDAAALEHFGEFAWLNFPRQMAVEMKEAA
jgi:hypothetical protein